MTPAHAAAAERAVVLLEVVLGNPVLAAVDTTDLRHGTTRVRPWITRAWVRRGRVAVAQYRRVSTWDQATARHVRGYGA